MAGKMINQLPADAYFASAHDGHLFMYQRSDDDITHKVTLSEIITAIVQAHILVDGNITKSVEGNVVTLTGTGGSDGQAMYITDTEPEDPEEGAFWLHTDNAHFGDIDKYTDVEGTMTWVYQTNMKGADGADGQDGITPHINSSNKHWMIGETDTNVVAEGQNGQNGQDGQDGVTPHIDSTSKHWMIGLTDTGVKAEGQDGAGTTTVGTTTTGAAGTQASVVNSGTSQNAILDFTIPRGADGTNGTDGDDGYSISATVSPITGGNRITIQSTDPSASDQTFDVMNGTNGTNGSDGDDGASISAAVTTITGGHRVTISSTDTQVADQSFDVMDGTNTIQTTSANYTATLSTSGWSSTAPYTQTVTVQGMTSSIIPIIGLIVSNNTATGIEEEKQWSYVTKATSGTDSITFSCYETKPTVAMTVNIKAV